MTPRGELVLRRVGDDFEVISNGVFLMDTRDGRSERALVREAVRRHTRRPRRLLIGGLGVGLLARWRRSSTDLRVEQVVVVEIEQALVDWHASHLRERTGSALADPRVQVVVADVRDHLTASPAGYDVDLPGRRQRPGLDGHRRERRLLRRGRDRGLRQGARAGRRARGLERRARPARTSSCSGSSSTTCRSSRSRRTSNAAHPTSSTSARRPARSLGSAHGRRPVRAPAARRDLRRAPP